MRNKDRTLEIKTTKILKLRRKGNLGEIFQKVSKEAKKQKTGEKGKL